LPPPAALSLVQIQFFDELALPLPTIQEEQSPSITAAYIWLFDARLHSGYLGHLQTLFDLGDCGYLLNQVSTKHFERSRGRDPFDTRVCQIAAGSPDRRLFYAYCFLAT
jgi:hypothetical protein